ncbi:pyocin knob domain-containing S74 family peptidase [Atlantibacter sp.]|uniref:tail fiber domain-containing protein n=1 Tax=Atlantibacter sp. TaxID=1903473 RepID=UPI0028A6511D|nr:pyocin knob domain-containing S74 family peptidase [Atlantibacter sp.]
MSAGTLKLTNNSTAVVGTSTLFTTDLKPGDFIVTTIGGVLYTLPVDTVTSNTAATLVSPFTGPTTTGAAWAAVPRKTMNQVTAELVNQSTVAIRALLAEKGNWMNFYTAPGDISIQPGDSAPAVSGPGWQKMAGLVGSAQQWRGNLPAAANLNTYGPTSNNVGLWGFNNTGATIANGFPEAYAQGIFEVFNGGPYLGSQRFTNKNGSIYARTLTGSWNGVDGPWGEWQPTGKKPLNDLGLGLTSTSALASMDWNQFDFVSGQEFSVAASNMTNTPPGIDTTGWGTTAVCFNVIGFDGSVATVECWLSHVTNSLFRRYQIRISGSKGSRIFAVRQIWTSADTVPIANGGTGGTTQATARTGLGLGNSSTRNVGTAAGTVAAGDDARLNSLEGKSGGTMLGQIVNTPSTAQGETKTAPYNTFIQYSAALPLFTHVASSTIQKTGGVGSQFTLGFSFGGYIGSAGTADASGPMLVSSDGQVYTKYWNFVNGSGGINTANGGILPTVCDIRLKDNPRDAQAGGLTRILSIKPREFNWKWDGRHDRGFIAQELKKVDPLYVFEAGGEDPDEPILNLSHIAIISDLVAAVQGLHEQNVTQLDEITSLRQELDELKEKVGQLIAN